MSVVANFSSTYAEAREKFCAAAAAAGAALRSRRNPTQGPGGEALYTDIARLGPDDASNMLVLTSATHGIEGYCGSGAQISWLRQRGLAALPKDTGALLIHAVNPHGFAWTRRVNEDNVDLNRNFVDHAKPYPRNEGYVELADAIKPPSWDQAALAKAQQVFDAFIQKHGMFGFQGAISGGQYTHKDGVFYGGARPTWSNVTIRKIIRQELSQAERIGVIDFHTGLGPFGHGEIIATGAPGSPAMARTKAWYGEEVTSPESGTSTSAVVVGVMVDAFPQEAPFAETTSVALEYGTYPVLEVLQAVRQDNWLHAHGDLASAPGREMKAYMRERFYPAEDRWKEMVWTRADEVIGKALKGLTA
ncbi:MAG: M14 family metallopeptidase [Reyranellaceae bacterium]